MKEFLSITKAMGDESRLRALLALAGGELCLCQIIELLGLAPSTVSKHMAVLHHAGLVETRKQGRWIFYSLAEGSTAACVRAAVTLARECLANDERVLADAKRLHRIRKMDRDELCCHYHPETGKP